MFIILNLICLCVTLVTTVHLNAAGVKTHFSGWWCGDGLFYYGLAGKTHNNLDVNNKRQHGPEFRGFY